MMPLITVALLAALQMPHADSVVYTLAPTSRLEVKTGKSGLLGFAGHEHVIRARAFTGRVVYHRAVPEQSRVEIVILTDSLEVLTPPDTEEIRKVTADMRRVVLDVASYPEMRLVSRSLVLRGDTVQMVAALTMRDSTREVPLVAHIAIGGDTLRATTSFAVKQSDFGIRPYRGGPGGTVRVADKVTFDIKLVAVSRP
jgi:polyisoprenoid-binding protein YceI